MNKRFLFLFLPLGLLLLGVFAPDDGIKLKIKDLLMPNGRELIEKVDYPLDAENSLVVIKIKDKKGLYLEIFSMNKYQDIKLLHKEKLTEKLNAQVQVNHQQKSLFVIPIDSEKKLKILAPTLDANLRPYLNGFVWNIEAQTLELLR